MVICPLHSLMSPLLTEYDANIQSLKEQVDEYQVRLRIALDVLKKYQKKY